MPHSYTYRFFALLVAVLFGLAWGAPGGHASCIQTGPSSSTHCDTPGPVQHCEADMGPTSAVCFSNHVSQEALTGTSFSSDTQEGSGLQKGARIPSVRATTSVRPFIRHDPSRARRLYARVAVWLE